MKNIIFWSYSPVNGYSFWLKSKKLKPCAGISFLPPVNQNLIEFENELFTDKINHVIGLLLLGQTFDKNDFELVKFD